MVKKNTSSKNKNNCGKLKIPLIIVVVLLIVSAIGCALFASLNNVNSADYIVETNAFFAPFEYYEGKEIVGVDREIINRVATYMGKSIIIKDVEFDVIIDNVASGKIADAGAAGLTVTEARMEKVDFSIPYYSSVQYLLYDASRSPVLRGDHATWEVLENSSVGSQTGGTGYLFVQAEIEEGVLVDKNVELKGYESHQLAADAVSAGILDYVLVDELAAKYIVSKNPNLAVVPLYYTGNTVEEDYPVEESYAIAVNKDRPELLEAFNTILAEMLEKDENGVSEIDYLVLKYMGFDE